MLGICSLRWPRTAIPQPLLWGGPPRGAQVAGCRTHLVCQHPGHGLRACSACCTCLPCKQQAGYLLLAEVFHRREVGDCPAKCRDGSAAHTRADVCCPLSRCVGWTWSLMWTTQRMRTTTTGATAMTTMTGGRRAACEAGKRARVMGRAVCTCGSHAVHFRSGRGRAWGERTGMGWWTGHLQDWWAWTGVGDSWTGELMDWG